jgi:hypothetical protein
MPVPMHCSPAAAAASAVLPCKQCQPLEQRLGLGHQPRVPRERSPAPSMRLDRQKGQQRSCAAAAAICAHMHHNAGMQ